MAFDREQELANPSRMRVGLRGVPVSRYHGPITPRENAIRTLTGQTPAWLGTDLNMVSPRLIPDNVARGVVVDGKPFDPDREAGGPDWFGVEWTYEPLARGSMVKPGNPKVKDITYIPFPDLERLDWEGAARDCQEVWQADQLNSTQIYTGFLTGWRLFMTSSLANSGTIRAWTISPSMTTGALSAVPFSPMRPARRCCCPT